MVCLAGRETQVIGKTTIPTHLKIVRADSVVCRKPIDVGSHRVVHNISVVLVLH